MLDVRPRVIPEFGFRARVPLANGKFDRTEVDMRLGDLLIEAKLTESNFQRAPKAASIATSVRYSTLKTCLRPNATFSHIS
jgi:hypothetical protein